LQLEQREKERDRYGGVSGGSDGRERERGRERVPMTTARIKRMMVTKMTMNLMFCHHIFLLNCLDFDLNLNACIERSSVYHKRMPIKRGSSSVQSSVSQSLSLCTLS